MDGRALTSTRVPKSENCITLWTLTAPHGQLGAESVSQPGSAGEYEILTQECAAFAGQ